MLYLTAFLGLSAHVDPTDMHADPKFPAFMRFISAHRSGVGYSSELETLGRFNAFKANLQRIDERNAKGNEKHGVNKFSDLTPEEFRSKFTGLRPASNTALKAMKTVDHGVAGNYTAASVDWNTKGALTPIKNQGQCGSCWAFSATEQLESQYFQSYGTLKELSPQQITSCTTTCLGCSGGNPIDAWFYVNSYGGQDPASDYPYVSGTSTQTGSCGAIKSDVTEDISSTVGYYISQTPAQEKNMLAQIELSPMSITVDAELWQTYTGGIITSTSGCGTSIDHAVQATGYNAAGNYWIVRNSWGADWGEQGFVYVQEGANVCGITSQATITDPAKVAKLEL